MPLRDSIDLVDLIRWKIINRRLPGYTDRFFTGHGGGHPCACCQHPISRGEREYEIDWERPHGAAQACTMHEQCFQLWSGVLRRIALEGGPSVPRSRSRP
jgi:hypothetical protein